MVRDRFPDRHVHKFTNRPHDKPESTKVKGRVLHLFIGTIIANMLHLEIPKLTLTIITVA